MAINLQSFSPSGINDAIARLRKRFTTVKPGETKQQVQQRTGTTVAKTDLVAGKELPLQTSAPTDLAVSSTSLQERLDRVLKPTFGKPFTKPKEPTDLFTTQTTQALGDLPRNQAEMEIFQKTRTFNPATGKWELKATETTPTTPTPAPTLGQVGTGIGDVAERVRALQERIRTEGVTPTPTQQPIQPTQQPIQPTQPTAFTTGDLEKAAGISTPFEDFTKAIKDAFKPVADAQKAFIDELRATPSLVEEFAKLTEAAGIPELRDDIRQITTRAADVEAQLEELPDDVKKRVQDFLVTQNQLNRLTEFEAKPITQLLNALSRAKGVSLEDLRLRQSEVSTILGLVEKDTARKLEALELGIRFAQTTAGIESRIAEVGFETEQARIAAEQQAIPGRARDIASVAQSVLEGDIIDNIDQINQLAIETGVPFETLFREIKAAQGKATLQELTILQREKDLFDIEDPLERTKALLQIANLEADLAKKQQTILGDTGLFTKFIGGVEFIPNPNQTATQKQKVNTLESGLSLINQIERLYANAVGVEIDIPILGGALSRLKGVTRTIGITTGLFNENFAVYSRFLESNRTAIAKGLKGEVGNLTEGEQKAALKAFPGRFTPPNIAKKLFEEARQQVINELESLGTLAGVPQFGTQSFEDDFSKFIIQ